MKAWAAIALAAVLSGCAGADYSPLQRDLQELAALPQRLDTFVREQTVRPQTAAAAPDAGPETTATLAPLAEEAAPAAVTPQPNAAQVKKAPLADFLDRLKQTTASSATARSTPTVEPGAHDLIPEPIPVENPLARPPWEALAEAGPDADNDIDLELLYGAGQVPAELLAEQAQEPQVAVAADLAPSPNLGKPAKPAAVVIKAVAVPQVTGAPGNGNAELTEAMRKALKQAGWPVLAAPREDALTVQGRVAFGKAHGANQSVKIVWDVLSPDGARLGDLKQDNAVAAGSLDESWGENADYAAEAAAEGIFKLIQKYR